MNGARDDGGPAFPVAGMTGLPNGEVVYGENGMTLRDYFIAHAPAEPQPWFSPSMPPAEQPLPYFAQMYPDCTEAEKKAFQHYDPEYMPIDLVQEKRVRNYLFQKEHEAKRNRERNALAGKERYLQWPAAWADAMLKARQS